MIHTTFVIGAGASKEVGLPLGTELKRSICAGMSFCEASSSDGTVMAEAFTHYAQSNQDYFLAESARGAGRKLCRGLPLARSIDHFVNNHRDDEMLVRVAKWAITERILHHERNSRLFISGQGNRLNFFELENTWYMSLVNILFEDCPWADLPGRLNRLLFIIFNYDRCFEYFLVNAVAAHYDRSLGEAHDCIRSHLRIFHPYGQVGGLSIKPTGNPNDIVFGGGPTAQQLRELGGCIRTFSERIDDSNTDLAEARASIQESRRIVFLGFSYMQINIELLIPAAVPAVATHKNKLVMGTAFGMSALDLSFAKNLLRKKFRVDEMAVDLQPLDSFNYISQNAHSLRFSGMD